jgi:hypothetical protein
MLVQPGFQVGRFLGVPQKKQLLIASYFFSAIDPLYPPAALISGRPVRFQGEKH